MKYFQKYVVIFLLSCITLNAQWEQYKVSNSNIPTDNILSLALDSKNNLWMSTDSGLVKFDGVNNWQYFNKQNSMNPSNYNAAIAVDKNDVVWSSSEGGDFAFSFDGNNWNLYNYQEYNIRSFYVHDIHFDYANRPWFATDRYVKFLESDKWTEIEHAPDISGFRSTNCIEMDKKNEIWIGTETEGLLSYYNSKLTYYKTSNSDIPTNRLSCMTIDSMNNIWIGTKDTRILRFNKLKDEWTIFTFDVNTITKKIYQIKTDSEGVVWASLGLNLMSFNGSGWDSLKLDEDKSILKDEGVGILDFVFNEFGNLWVTTTSDVGIFKYTRNPETNINQENITREIKLFPNPTSDYVTTELENDKIIKSIEIIDVNGKLLKHLKDINKPSERIEISSLSKGLYILKTTDIDNEVVYSKLIVN